MVKNQNPRVYMDIVIARKPTGRIIIELFTDTTPLTAHTFRSLCTGENPAGLCYKGSNFWCGDSDRVNGGNCGSQQEQQIVYGLSPKRKNLIRKHDSPGIVSMIKPGCPEFTIALTKLPHYDVVVNNILQVVFGKVVEGLDVVQYIANKSFPQLALITHWVEINLKEIMNVNKQLITADPKDFLAPENEKELVESAEIFQRSLNILSDLKAVVCSLEKRQNELLCQTITEITIVKERKHVMEMISSFPYNDLVNIENVIKKSKSDG